MTFRVTETTIANSTLNNLQSSLQKMQNLQQQLSSGKLINVPSDDPSGAVTAMGLRADQTRTTQYQRNASDGLGWLGTANNTLTSALSEIQRVRQLVVAGANGTEDVSSRTAMADEIGTTAQGLIGLANTTYENQPIFAGTANPQGQTPPLDTYDASGNYNGNTGTINRTVGPEATVQVNLDGPSVWGDPSTDTIFKVMTDIQSHLTSSDPTEVAKLTQGYTNPGPPPVAMQSDLDRLDALTQNVQNRLSQVGARYHRVQTMQSSAGDNLITIQQNLSNTENVDLPQTIVNLQMQQTAYQAALSATAKVIQPSLVDFLH